MVLLQISSPHLLCFLPSFFSISSIFCFTPPILLGLFRGHSHSLLPFTASLFTNILFYYWSRSLSLPIKPPTPILCSVICPQNHVPSSHLAIVPNKTLRSLTQAYIHYPWISPVEFIYPAANDASLDFHLLICIISCLYRTFFTPAFHDYSDNPTNLHTYSQDLSLCLLEICLPVLVQLLHLDQLSNLPFSTCYFVPYSAHNPSKRLFYRNLCGTAQSCRLIYSGCRKHKQ